MARKMLIDATHSEEVRVAVVDGNRLEEFDSETSTKKQLKGNVYLAKIVRIEPSLQAAFVDFGGNRHGFLPFGEIHPDYYRIPVSDRSVQEHEEIMDGEIVEEVLSVEADTIEEMDKADETMQEEMVSGLMESLEEEQSTSEKEEVTAPHPKKSYRYKIQEVIKRRQIMLVQVVREERGNKGAALTTYLSLPGRYCVLMPNAGHRGGGISRKISDGQDRRRLRDVLKELEMPDGMSLIVRTAGQERNKLEIRRDFDYLTRLWEEIRDATLQAIAPTLVYAEGDLIKRAIRDIYSRNIEQVLVEGEEGYKAAKHIMKALTPSHAKRVQPYRDETIPLFQRFKVEEQIDNMMHPVAMLPSGGSIVINPTEALVAIDVNSGKSIRERHIDETALKTNLEAADEVARQMRLRDLGGLVVIDFIDMNDSKNIQAVEKRLKEAVQNDRARVQMGRISQFGLLELSRQRLHPSITEANTMPCSLCRGSGVVRSIESMALHVLREIEGVGVLGSSAQIAVAVPPEVDLYLLNQKRSTLISIEQKYQMSVSINRDETLISPDLRIDVLTTRTAIKRDHGKEIPLPPDIEEESDESSLETASEEDQEIERMESRSENHEGEPEKRRSRRRQHYTQQRRNRHREDRTWSVSDQIINDITPSTVTPEDIQGPIFPTNVDEESDFPPQGEKRDHRRRRRGRRSGNRPRPVEASGESSAEPRHEAAGSASGAKPEPHPKESRKRNDSGPKEGAASNPPSEVDAPQKTQKKKGWWKRLIES